MIEPLSEDQAKALEVLRAGPAAGLTLDEIMARCSWSCRTANMVLCELHLMKRIMSERVRGRRGTETLYRIRPKEGA